jgi:hypothetical protein
MSCVEGWMGRRSDWPGLWDISFAAVRATSIRLVSVRTLDMRAEDDLGIRPLLLDDRNQGSH